MKIASPIFRNYEGSTCIVRSKSTIRKGDEITDNYGFFYQIHPEEERKETLSKQGPFINYVDLGWDIIISIFSVCFDMPVFFLSWTIFDVSIQNPFLRKLLPQLLYLNGFFSSWPDLMYSFRFTFWIKLLSQMLHLNGFFRSWTNSICPFICLFCEKLASQILHLNGFFPSWTDLICPFRFCVIQGPNKVFQAIKFM